jgi:cysteine synthase B
METSIVPAIYDDAVADSRIEVSTEQAQEAARVLARRGGILLGPSGGANLSAAVRLGRDLAEQGREAVVVTIFPDAGERYLGERFWTP